ncbi:hypothetical protein HK096_000591, partial [Nowakowskiella sp. JEL0078]
LVVKQPFSTALENLTLLFEKAKKRGFTGVDDEKMKARGVFIREFTILMGNLMAKEKELKIFDSTKNSVLAQLDSLLTALNFDSKLLSRVFTVTLSVLYLQASPPLFKTTDNSPNNQTLKRGTNTENIESQQILLFFLCELSCVVLAQTNKFLQHQIQNYKPPKSQKLTPESFAHGTLPTLKILTKWLLVQSYSPLSFPLTKTYELEHKLWTLIAEFANLVCRLLVQWSPEVGRLSLDDIVERCRTRNLIDSHRWKKIPILKQDIELKGFLPLIAGENSDVEDTDYEVYEEFEGRGGREMEAWMAVQILQFIIGITESLNPKLFVTLNTSVTAIQFSSTPPPQMSHPQGLSSRPPAYIEPDDLRFSHRLWTTNTPFPNTFPESPTVSNLQIQNLTNFSPAPHFIQQLIKPTAIGSERRSSISGVPPPGLTMLNRTGSCSTSTWPSAITTPPVMGLVLDVSPQADEMLSIVSAAELSDDVNTIAFLGLENASNVDLTFPERKFSIQSIPLSLTSSPGFSQTIPQQTMWMNSPVIPRGINHSQDEVNQLVFSTQKAEDRESWIGVDARKDLAMFAAWQ